MRASKFAKGLVSERFKGLFSLLAAAVLLANLPPSALLLSTRWSSVLRCCVFSAELTYVVFDVCLLVA